jgi:hypothetical protein
MSVICNYCRICKESPLLFELIKTIAISKEVSGTKTEFAKKA